MNSGVSVTLQSPSASPLDTAFPFLGVQRRDRRDARDAAEERGAARERVTSTLGQRRKAGDDTRRRSRNRRPLETHRDRVRAHGSRGELDVVTSVGLFADA